MSALSFAGAPSTQPLSPADAQLLAHLESQMQKVQSVQSDFVETKILAMIQHKLIIRGHLALARPDRLIWIADTPEKYALRLEGDEVTQWDADTNQVSTMHLNNDPTFQAVSQQLRSWFLGNYQALHGDYSVRVASRRPVTLEFTPNSDSMVAKLIARIDVSFQADTRYIDSMTLQEASQPGDTAPGDTTTIQYIHAKINEPVPDATWEIPPHDQ